jgi:cysteine desulfurase
MQPIYLDYASTTPLLPEAAQAMAPFWHDRFGNPSSVHLFGRRARQALEDARECLAHHLGARPDEVVFTSGATEANNLAIHGALEAGPGPIVVSGLEHPSVAAPLSAWQERGCERIELPVTAGGQVAVEHLDHLQGRGAGLLAVMLVNNETGVIQPVAEVVERVGSWVRHVHCDAAQAAGKLPIHFHRLGVATLSISGHKFHGPRGVGALLVRRGVRLRPLFQGGHQQAGLRPGTEPVVLAVGMARALEIALRDRQQRWDHIRQVRDLFLQELHRSAAPIAINGDLQHSVPYVLNVSFPGCPGDILLARLDLAGVACSTGSACSSGSLLPSPVLRAMGCPPEQLRSALRFSFSHQTTPEEAREAAQRIAAAVRELRQHS